MNEIKKEDRDVREEGSRVTLMRKSESEKWRLPLSVENKEGCETRSLSKDEFTEMLKNNEVNDLQDVTLEVLKDFWEIIL